MIDVVSRDENFPWKKAYIGENAINKFLNDMIKESRHFSKVIETEFNKPFVMNEKIYENFKNFNKCWIGKKYTKKIK